MTAASSPTLLLPPASLSCSTPVTKVRSAAFSSELTSSKKPCSLLLSLSPSKTTVKGARSAVAHVPVNRYSAFPFARGTLGRLFHAASTALYVGRFVSVPVPMAFFAGSPDPLESSHAVTLPAMCVTPIPCSSHQASEVNARGARGPVPPPLPASGVERFGPKPFPAPAPALGPKPFPLTAAQPPFTLSEKVAPLTGVKTSGVEEAPHQRP